MLTRFKRFLLIYMMLALPVQAFASVSLMGCELSHPDAMAQVSMDQAMTGCHEMSDEQPNPPVADHHCSHCAACYLVSALPIPASLASLAVPVPYIPHAHYAAQFSGFIPEGPERPPRTPLA